MSTLQKAPWQIAMSQAITDSKILLEILELDSKFLAPAQKASQLFGLRVPKSFINRMEKRNPNDPLLLQVLPLHAEMKEKPGFISDPLQENKFNPLPGLLHKYSNRVLITLVGSCGINCRYCFRREFPYDKNNPGKKSWDNIFHYISERPEITEVILSGGDPLVASDDLLKAFSQKLLDISHIKTLRIHSRMPIVIPERITNAFIDYLEKLPLQKILVIHCNHPNEINNDVKYALKKLNSSNITLLNQSVLLKNINDHENILIQLSEKLWDINILPYYLHLLDKVKGTAHFDVNELTAKKLIKKMQEKLPGYLVPRLVREVPGEKHKTMV
jgi:EF-P beta-lysylation protein EpmB